MSLEGVFAYLPTLFDERERLDEAATRRLVDDLVGAGVHGLTPLGSTGEFPYVDVGDRARLARVVVEAAAGRVPVVHGVGGFALRDVVAQARAAADAGVDGLLVVQQAFYGIDDDQIVDLHRAAAEASGLPVVAYHNPGQCRVPFSLSTVARLGALDGVVGFKDASGDLRNIRRWQDACDGGTRMFAATAVPLVPAMLYGAVGWMAGPACVVPTESLALHRACRQGDWARALAIEQALAALGAAFVRLGQAQTIKSLLAAEGYGTGHLARPLRPVPDDEAHDLTAILTEARARVAELTNGDTP